MKRFSVVENGYDINEVNNFVDVVIKRLEKLNTENNNYLNELTKLKQEVEKNKKTDTTTELQVTQAIIAANETANKMKQIAKEESTLIITEAKDNATAIVHEALVQAQKTEQERQILEKNISIYKAKVKSLIESQLALIEDIDKMN